MSHADELLNRYVLREFRDGGADGTNSQLISCPDAFVGPDADYRNGSYGCETGCDYLRLEATITCPHGESYDYEYGEFGEIADLIKELEDEERRGT